MKTLGIDYGRSKIGLAIGVGSFAEPMQVIRYTDIKILREQIKEIVEKENIDKVIVGVSEGKIGEESKKFAKELGAITFDETLTSRDAQRLSIEAGVKRSRRKLLEDSYAAAIMLQSYLDQNV